MFVIKYRNFFFVLSGILLIGSCIGLGVWGLKPSIEFAGGSTLSVDYGTSTQPTIDATKTALAAIGFEDVVIRTEGENGINIRTRALVEGDRDKLAGALTALGGNPTIERLSSIGPSVGQELRHKTAKALVMVIVMIMLYIAFVFRKVSKPISSWVYGFVTIVTLVHDVVIPAGVFVLLGHFVGYEADTLFVVAILTILGLSVTDTVVVFDRVRENLERGGDVAQKNFTETVGTSLEQTYVRSFNTSFTVILVLLVLFFVGSASVHTFVLTLLVGIIAGTYSSIFIASPLLVVFANRKLAKAGKK